MLESFLITSRETLEASLVVGIVLAYLNKTGNQQHKKSVYYGIFFGIAASILAAFLFTLAAGFEGITEQIFEGVTMLIGAFLLTTMILWMWQQNHTKEIEGRVAGHLKQPLFSHFGIFLLIFIAIIREGVETVIFLNAARYANSISLIGGISGMIAAIGLGYAFFIGVGNLRRIFGVSSILLILFAAGLVSQSIHEFEEAGIVSGIITPLFDINPSLNADGTYPLFHEKGGIGSFLKGLFGYNGNPSLAEAVGYVLFLALVGILWRKAASSKK